MLKRGKCSHIMQYFFGHSKSISRCLPSSCHPLDPGPRGFPDGGVWGRVQPQGAEGRSSRGDGAVGRHPHCPARSGAQPQDLHVCQGPPGVSPLQTLPVRAVGFCLKIKSRFISLNTRFSISSLISLGVKGIYFFR